MSHLLPYLRMLILFSFFCCVNLSPSPWWTPSPCILEMSHRGLIYLFILHRVSPTLSGLWEAITNRLREVQGGKASFHISENSRK
uniref:Putative ovule protein n=1 Tax=Solanum chacoense TaxID=4108 RepID=A0A0V0IPH9_SOLCH